MAKVKFPERTQESWVNSYIKYTHAQEAPELFHAFIALAVLSCAINRDVYLEMGYYKVYPNIYLLLLAGSASARKTVALTIGRKILEEAFPLYPIFAQKGSPQAMIKRLKETAEKAGKGYMLIFNDEFSTFLGHNKQSKSELIDMLTTLYDCEDTWSYDTVARGKETVPNVWCSLMAGMTPDTMKETLPPSAVGTGFTSRLLLIYQERSVKARNYRPLLSLEIQILRDKLITDLQLISLARGPMKFSEEGEGWYQDWYEQIHNPDRSIPGMSGYFGRKHTILLKLAMLLSLSRTSTLLIDEIDLKMALELLNEHEKFLPGLMGTLVSEGSGDKNIRVLRAIEKRGTISHADLVHSMNYCLNARELSDVLTTLLSGGSIEEEPVLNKTGPPGRVYKIKKRSS